MRILKMAQVTCHACEAFFEVDFEVGTRFTCGSCGATLEVPANPTPAPPTPMKVQPRQAQPKPAAPKITPRSAPAAGPAKVAPRKAAAPKAQARAAGPAKNRRPSAAGLPKRSAGQRPANSGRPAKKSQNGMIMAAAGGVILLGGILFFVLPSDDKPTNGDQNSSQAGANKPKPVVDAYEVARTKTRTGSVEALQRFGDLAWQRSENESDPKKKQKYLRDAQSMARQVISKKAGDKTSHERLGHVLFDKNEAKALMGTAGVDEDSLMELELISEEASDLLKGDASELWLDPKSKRREGELARKWVSVRDQVIAFRDGEKERTSDPFYRAAQKMGDQMAREIMRGQVDFKLKGVTGEPFAIFAFKPYVFIVQKSSRGTEEKTARSWNNVLQSLQRKFYARYADQTGLTKMTRPTPVVVLEANTEYTKYQRRHDGGIATRITSAGHFEPGANRLVCYQSTEDEQRNTLFHEGTHQIVQWGMRSKPLAGASQAMWFSEGLADYFGGNAEIFVGGKKDYAVGRLNIGRIETLGNSRKNKDLIPLAELIDYRRRDYAKDNRNPRMSAKVAKVYAQGWALCYFLQNWKKDKYGSKWADYMKEEFQGRSGLSVFKKIFGSDIATMEREYLEMIDVLEKARVDKTIVNGELRNPPK